MRELNFLRVFIRSYSIWTVFWLSWLALAMLILLAMNTAPFAIVRWMTGNAGNPFISATESKAAKKNPFGIPVDDLLR